MTIFTKVIMHEGRKFIVRFPSTDDDAVLMTVHPQFQKPCKIIGIAKPDTPEGHIFDKDIKNIIIDYED